MLDLHNTDLTLLAGVEKARRQKIAEMIRREQVIDQIKPRKAGLRDRALASIGGALVTLGNKLQERSVLILSPHSGTNPPDC